MTDLIDYSGYIKAQHSKKFNIRKPESIKKLISKILKKFNGWV